MALVPPSVTQGAPSGPMITPCGAAAGPSGMRSTLPRGGVEAAELAVALGGIPDDAVGADGDVVRAAPRRKGIHLHRDFGRRHRSRDGGGGREQCGEERE